MRWRRRRRYVMSEDDWDPTAAPTGDVPSAGEEPPDETDPQAVDNQVTAAIAGPLTVPPSGADRDLLPGITDVAADLGYALGVGSDDLGLVEVEVNGLMGVRVELAPGLVQVDHVQVGHSLASALEQARAAVVAALDEHLRANKTVAGWIAEATRKPDTIGDPSARPAPARQSTVASPDGLVSVVVEPDGGISSVLVTETELDLDELAASFVRAAETALQSPGEDGGPLLIDDRVAEFDRAIGRLGAGLDELGAELDAVLKKL